MSLREKRPIVSQLNQRLATNGLRFTAQRKHVYDILTQDRDHPTAEEVFMRAKREMPEISMATVYNCLDALVKCNLVRQVNLGRGATRFCPNMKRHSHFYCDKCGTVVDIDSNLIPSLLEISLPKGFELLHSELSLRGHCPACSGKE